MRLSTCLFFAAYLITPPIYAYILAKGVQTTTLTNVEVGTITVSIILLTIGIYIKTNTQKEKGS